jgi:betaine-aldehyde dehydrogenase
MARRTTVHVREGIFVDGEWRPSSGDAMFPVVDPYREEQIGAAAIGTAEDIDLAARSAHRALTSGEWADTTVDERIAMVKKVRELLAGRADELAEITSRSMGVPVESYRDLCNSFALIDTYIEQVREVQWEYVRLHASGDALIVRRPVGAVGGIVPWNVPIRSELKKLIPAILAGCSIVLKPAPETPFGAAALAEICTEAGLPKGVVNLVPGDGSTGDHLVKHPLVRKVAFTGSSATGSRIWSAVAPKFTRLQLELGGKSAAIVLDDVDLDRAIPALSAGIFPFSGQQCTATSRILAPRARYEEVVAAMAEAARRWLLGDPMDKGTTMGPLVAARQRDRVLGYLEAGRAAGARVAIGGGVPADQPRGFFVEPTVFADVDNSMRIAREEIFGPVAVVIPYDGEDDAVAIANDSDFGLGGAVYSADPARALAVARRVDSGYISVNRYGIPPTAPFGGVKASGIGREGGVEGYDSFLEYISHPLEHDFALRLAEEIPAG